MLVQFLEIESLTKPQLENLYEDIQLRLKWNRHQLHLLSMKRILDLCPGNFTVLERKESYSKAIEEYQQDLINIHNQINKMP